ncbi:hypothetical protein O1M63_45280 [Streptomyces mirabilis]|nr:hypothetical protein [Streptomyces mirabilis]
MIALILALGSSLAYGCADFLGGLGARKAHVLRTVMIAAPASLAVELLLWPFLGASFSAGALGWGAASGIASAAAFALLYRTLAIGPMNVLSPVTALVSAVLPVAVGLLQGEHLGAAGLAGLPLALVAVILVSAGHGAGSARPSRTALLSAFGAGGAIALQLVFLHQAPSDTGVAPLIIGRAVSLPSSWPRPASCTAGSAPSAPRTRCRQPPACWTPWRTCCSFSLPAAGTSPSSP